MKKPIVIAHRGDPGNDPEFGRVGENTMLSFESAIKKGAKRIEYDVRRCGNGELVVFHDDTLVRTTGQPGSVADYSYDELSEFDAGYGEPIPLLDNVLRRFGWDIIHNIELKEANLAEDVLKLVQAYDLEDQVVVSAFDVRDDPDGDDGTVTWGDLDVFPPAGVKIALLADEEKIKKMGIPTFIAEAVKRRASAINPSLAAADELLVEAAHAAGLEVYVWTVNKRADIERMVKIGVDGFFCDFAGRKVW